MSDKNIIHIIGQNSLQNDLFANYLSQATGFEVTSNNSVDQIDINSVLFSGQLVLFDCMGIASDELWTKIGVGTKDIPEKMLIALFNIERNKGIEKEAISRGIRGVFYSNESTDIFTKGIMSIFEGEMWYPRKTISQCLIDSRNSFKSTGDAVFMLTAREKEMLAEIASGASNQEIADTLYVSLHTVKTHIYNIFKKIKVSNRLQATLWAAKHL